MFRPTFHEATRRLRTLVTSVPRRTESVTVRDDRHAESSAPTCRRSATSTTSSPPSPGRSKSATWPSTSAGRELRAVHSLCSRLYGGASSFFNAPVAEDRQWEKRFYVPTLMGLFPGQRLKIDLIDPPIFTVEHLGLDAQGPSSETVELAPRDIEAGALVTATSTTCVLSLSDTSNCDNQGTTINLHRRAYGAGDLPVQCGARLSEQHLLGGRRRGAIGCSINLQHDLGPSGVVESWTPAPGRRPRWSTSPRRAPAASPPT